MEGTKWEEGKWVAADDKTKKREKGVKNIFWLKVSLGISLTKIFLHCLPLKIKVFESWNNFFFKFFKYQNVVAWKNQILGALWASDPILNYTLYYSSAHFFLLILIHFVYNVTNNNNNNNSNSSNSNMIPRMSERTVFRYFAIGKWSKNEKVIEKKSFVWVRRGRYVWLKATILFKKRKCQWKVLNLIRKGKRAEKRSRLNLKVNEEGDGSGDKKIFSHRESFFGSSLSRSVLLLVIGTSILMIIPVCPKTYWSRKGLCVRWNIFRLFFGILCIWLWLLLGVENYKLSFKI